MKFPVPNTLTGAVSPMLVINWVFGIGVIEYPIGRPRRILSAFWSIVNLMIYLGFLKMANFSEIADSRESVVDGGNYYANACFGAVYVVTCICVARMKAKVIAETLFSLTKINDRLDILTIPNDYELLFKTQIIQLGLAFASMSIMIVFDYEYLSAGIFNEASRIGFISSCHYMLLFSFFLNYTFSGSIRYFCNRFQRLNTFLIESVSLDRTESLITQSDNQFPQYSAVVREVHGHDAQSIRTLKKQWLLYIVRETRKVHRDLCKTATKLNRAFDVHMMFTVVAFVNLTTSLLFVTYFTAMASPRVDDFWVRNIISTTWIMGYGMIVILVVDTCEATSCEANRTGELINKLLDTTAQDDDIRDEMNTFSLQLLQNPLNFTANGFFPLNYSLIHGIIGSMANYLIIMIQMQDIHEPVTNMNSTSN